MDVFFFYNMRYTSHFLCNIFIHLLQFLVISPSDLHYTLKAALIRKKSAKCWCRKQFSVIHLSLSQLCFLVHLNPNIKHGNVLQIPKRGCFVGLLNYILISITKLKLLTWSWESHLLKVFKKIPTPFSFKSTIFVAAPFYFFLWLLFLLFLFLLDCLPAGQRLDGAPFREKCHIWLSLGKTGNQDFCQMKFYTADQAKNPYTSESGLDELNPAPNEQLIKIILKWSTKKDVVIKIIFWRRNYCFGSKIYLLSSE